MHECVLRSMRCHSCLLSWLRVIVWFQIVYKIHLLRMYYRHWFSGQFLNMEKHFIIIFAWSSMLIHHGTKGDIAILSTHLNLKEESKLAVQPGTTDPSRVIWRNSAEDVNTLPTTPDSLIIQWINNLGFLCPDGTSGVVNITCGKFKMNEDFGLVFTTVDFNDGKQKFWFEVTASSIRTSASVVPKVCDYGSIEISSCENDRCICSVVGFTPETDFTLEWTRNGNQVEGVTPPDIEEDVDGNYFSATSTISTENMPGNYICCASGDAYYFASSKKLCTSPTKIEGQRRSLSTGAIVGISVGIVIVAIAGVAGIIGVYSNCKKNDEENPSKEEATQEK